MLAWLKQPDADPPSLWHSTQQAHSSLAVFSLMAWWPPPPWRTLPTDWQPSTPRVAPPHAHFRREVKEIDACEGPSTKYVRNETVYYKVCEEAGGLHMALRRLRCFALQTCPPGDPLQ